MIMIFSKCKIDMGAIHKEYGVSYEKIES